MKTKFTHIAAVTFFALTILVGNVYADGSEKSFTSRENSEEGLATMSIIKEAETMSSLELFVTETTTEETIELENWMTSNEVWNIKSAESIETDLELENWMVNEDLWHKGESISIETVSEESLELENWMTNDQVWKTNTEVSVDLEIEKEETLRVEDWMTSENIWNK